MDLNKDILMKLEEMLSTYHRNLPAGATGPAWIAAPGLLPIPPGVILSYETAFPEAFSQGSRRFIPLQAIECSEYLDNDSLGQLVAGIFGRAYRELSQHGSFAAEVTMHAAQQAYFILQWKSLGDAMNSRPIIQVGNPLLNIGSREVAFDGSTDLDLIADSLLDKQRGTNSIYESPEKTSIIGYCQVHDFKSGDMVPYSAASIAFAGEKFENHLLLFNPRITGIDYDNGNFATNGWYGDFGRRIFQQAPVRIAAEYYDMDGTMQSLTMQRQGQNCSIEYTEGTDHRTVTRVCTPSDLNIFNLVVGQLIMGHTPYDVFKNAPVPYSGDELLATRRVHSEGYYPWLDAYYAADGRPGAETKARGVVLANAAHKSPDGKWFIPGFRAAGGLTYHMAEIERRTDLG